MESSRVGGQLGLRRDHPIGIGDQNKPWTQGPPGTGRHDTTIVGELGKAIPLVVSGRRISVAGRHDRGSFQTSRQASGSVGVGESGGGAWAEGGGQLA